MQQRLFEIIWHLTRHSGATAGQLAEKFGVSTRTIYRDIDALSAAGIPVYAEKGKGGGIRLLPDFVLDKTLFSREEQEQLVSHFSSLATIGTPDTQPVLDKLAALFGSSQNWLEVDFAPWGGGEEMRALFRFLRDAIIRRQTIVFDYVGANGVQRRQAQPLRIIFRGQGWYLQAFCLLRQDYRFFKLNRMQNTSLTGEGFAPVAPSPVPASFSGSFVEVVLWLSPETAYRTVDEFAPGQITRQPDGSFLVECTFPQGDWLEGYILSFGPQARVISPPELRDKMCAMLQDMIRGYDEIFSD